MFRLPTPSDWKLIAIAFSIFAVITVSFGFATGLFRFQLAAPLALARTAAIALVLPVFFEELVFRGPVIWLTQRKSRSLNWVAGLSFILFVLWHPLNAWLFLTQAREWFFDWRFLLAAAGLGAVTTWLAHRTGSLWPPAIFHWLVVLGWKAFLGAPTFL